MTGHPQADLLQQLADEAKVNPEFWREFQWKFNYQNKWRDEKSMNGLVESLFDPTMEVRRRPRTVRVSGEVPESVIFAARDYFVGAGGAGIADVNAIVKALVNLAEESE